MAPYYLISYRNEITLTTVSAFDLWFLAYSLNPFIAAAWLIAGLSGLSAFKPPGKYIFPSPEQGSEKSYFFTF
jgi:hypothetical protein